MTSLRRRAVRGASWSGGAEGVTTAARMVQMVVLARLLRPEDFGLMAMAMVVIGFAQAFKDMGLSNAIIYRQDVTRRQLCSLYWMNVSAGLALFLVVWGSAPLIAEFFGQPQLQRLVFLVGLTLPITAFGQQFQVLLRKELRFRALAKVQMGTVIASTLVAISAALLGQGVYSLVWGQIAHAVATSAVLVVIGARSWRPAFHFSRSDLKGYIGFGLYQMGERSVNFYSANVDTIVIGRFLGSEALGVYTIAYNLIIRPLKSINPVFTRIAFPIFARKQDDDEAIRRGYLEMLKLLGFVIFPVLVGLAVTAPLAIPALYGGQWDAAIPLVQVLVVLGIVKALGNPVGSVLLAKGRADIGFFWNIVVAVVNTAAFLAAIQFGLLALAWTYAVITSFYWVCGRFILQYVIGLGWIMYLRALALPALCTCIMASALLVSFQGTQRLALPLHAEFAGIVALGAAVYGCAALFSAGRYWQKTFTMVLNREAAKS